MAATTPALLTDSPARAATAPLSLEEYLRTSYHPDCDFVDGYLEGRDMGGTKHGPLQMELGHWFISRRKEWKIRVVSELRTRVSATRVRLPDLCVVPEDAALKEELRTTPALIAIEILSPDDRMNRVIQRLEEFLAMGVPNLWLLDPMERVAYTYTSTGLKLVQGPRLAVADSPIYLDLPEVFAALD
ncbi:MAG: Uma2 family endonuclease [Acidobacteriaceae bacterium]|jgi:Uma2 family endonuclease